MAFTGVDLFQVIAALVVVTFVTPLLGSFMFKIFSGRRNLLITVLRPLEVAIYKVSGVRETDEMNWKEYAKTLLIFNLIGLVFLMLLQMMQAHLPLNPEKLANVSWHLAFNTAVSFVTNTNWQAYSGENTLSYLTQMLGLGVQNFVSAATGLGVMLAPVLGRAAMLGLFLSTPYVRAGGLGQALAEHLPRRAGNGVLLATVLGCVWLGGWAALWTGLLALLVFIGLRRAMCRRLGGTTGDTAGAVLELLELTVVLSLALMPLA